MNQLPFASYLIVHRRRNLRLYVAFVAAGLLWGAFLTLVVIIGYLEVPEISPPALVVQWLRPQASPPPPAGPRRATPPPTRATPARVQTALAQPVAHPAPAAPAPADAPAESGDQGDPAGDSNGVPGGEGPPCVGRCPEDAPPPPPPPPPPPRLLPAVVIMTQLLSGETPHLPEAIKAQRRGTTVQGTYQMCMDQGGAITKVRVLSGIPGADEGITAALHTWRFRAQPFPVCFIRIIQFIVE